MSHIATTMRNMRILIEQERDIHWYHRAYAPVTDRLLSRSRDDSQRLARIVIAGKNVREGDTICFRDFYNG